jgi:hypothetical protein
VLPTTASLGYGDLGSALLTLGDPWIIQGPGKHRLDFPLDTYASWLEHEDEAAWTPMMLTGEAWADLPAMQWLGGIVPQTLTLRGWRAGGDRLAVELSDQQLLAIEAARDVDDDLRLHLKLQGTLLGISSETYPIRTVDVSASIRAASWTALLDQLGRAVAISLHVPSPLTDDGSPISLTDNADRASYAQATNRLRQARGQLRDGAYEESVASCRRVLEILGRLKSLPKPREIFDLAADKRSHEQRWAAMYYCTRSLTNAAHHDDETTADFVWTRADAEAVLATAAGLLLRLTSQ